MKKIELSKGIYTVELENPNEQIYWGAGFYSNCDLEELHIPEGVTAIAKKGLEYCERLKKVFMPTSVVYLGNSIFYGLKQTIEIYYAGTSEQFREIGKSRKVKGQVQVPGKYDVQPYCNSEGTYYKEETVLEAFDQFCADCQVICADGVRLFYGYKN